ncbi:MAG: HAD hydrolase family protein [Methanophagales archaeon]|nr:HAD hydrolase family protein [Methanophagales archaeon]MCW3142076.1 HAD hydrolase family protein [Methanophagales archaeon]
MVEKVHEMGKTIFFDLEGPLSPQDNAYEVMKLIGEEGAPIFEVISKYDDFISLEGREGYEPGDTLALIVPFFFLHGITEEDIRRVSERAKIVEGAEYLFRKLQADNWDIYIISTSYGQHAYNVGRKLGVPTDNIICTNISKTLREKKALPRKFFHTIKKAEEDIIELYSDIENTELIVNRLDEFFFHQLPSLSYDIFAIRVIGGERKAEAVRQIVKEKEGELSNAITVGDSITDYKMLNEVATHGGISVVFNGNEYAVPYANVGLASVDIRFLLILCDAFVRGGKGEVMEVATKWEENREVFEKNPSDIPDNCITADIRHFIMKQKKFFPYFHNIEHANERRKDEIIKIHKQVRMQVREDAGKLG